MLWVMHFGIDWKPFTETSTNEWYPAYCRKNDLDSAEEAFPKLFDLEQRDDFRYIRINEQGLKVIKRRSRK